MDWWAESQFMVEGLIAVEQAAVTWLPCWASSLIGAHVLIINVSVNQRVELGSPSVEHPQLPQPSWLKSIHIGDNTNVTTDRLNTMGGDLSLYLKTTNTSAVVSL